MSEPTAGVSPIAVERLRRHWSQRHLGQVAGLPHQTIGAIERDIGGAKFRNLVKIARAFQMPLHTLLPETFVAQLVPPS